MTEGVVVAVSRKATHGPDKPNCERVVLIAGQGVEGDAHCGAWIYLTRLKAPKHKSQNVRQIQLIHA